jgi:hypothetical protein
MTLSTEIGVALLDPFFLTCLRKAAADKEFIAGFDRLTGNNLSLKGAPIELMVDQACGRVDDGLRQFVEFVYETVYLRIHREPSSQ